MFSALCKVYGHFFGHEEVHGDEDEFVDEDKENEVQNIWPDSAFIIEEQEIDALNIRYLDGTVTHVFSGQGLIDGEIYFSINEVSGPTKPKIGDSVHLVAKQLHENGVWYAENVSIISQTWEEEKDEEVEEKSAFIGRITHMTKDLSLINDDVEFEIEECVENFKPMPGDFVTADLEFSKLSEDNEKKIAFNIKPLRTWTLNGEISAFMQDHGYINKEVYFTLDVCVNNYQPRKRDRVKVIALESQQGKCSWRATHVVPCSSDEGHRSSNENKGPRYQPAGGDGWVIPGQRPQRFQSTMKLPHKLPQFPVPESLRDCVWSDGELTTVAPELAQVLTRDNYIQRFSTLLHLEEIQMEIDIRMFDLHRVCMRRCGEFLGLRVPGLAEGRPSVLIGDKIILTDPGDPDGPCYEGFVHEIHSDEVLLKFNADFQGRYNGEDYNVEFTFNRTSLRRCHQAVALAFKRLGDSVLFPQSVDTKLPQIQLNKSTTGSDVIKLPSSYVGASNSQPIPESNSGDDSSQTNFLSTINSWTKEQIKFINTRLNDRQKAAVIKILLGQSRPVPYIIFGPPGTGKTMTMVEAILQVYSQIPSSRIIAATPSNSAADLLAERLIESGVLRESDIVRLNAFNRGVENIPESIEKFCRYGDDLQVISRYRIVVSTCNSAGSLYTLGLKPGHFTHAFVDEAGQSTEPECLVPLGLVAGADGQIVLAGDPKQLGPVLMSKYSKMYGLELSFLERLMERSLYMRNERIFADHGGFDSMLVTMLINNYRSHPAILTLPSRLFYYDQLTAVADPSLTHSLCAWKRLPQTDFPVIFHGVRGEDMRETDSPSWFNPMETVQVVQYLQSLLNDSAHNLTVEDVGIITPYRKQVEKLRLLMEKFDVETVKVGSVEEFQGQERPVIIISTVRANEKLIGFDVRHTLGFLSNAKRFNVSITRAQALLIIVGNPFVLCQDDKWRALIEYCVENRAYVGCEVPDFSTYTQEMDSPDDPHQGDESQHDGGQGHDGDKQS